MNMRTNLGKNRNALVSIAVATGIAVGALSGCEGLIPNDKPTSEEQARMDSIKVASTVRYGDPNKIITDKNGNPIPGPDGGSLRASDIPTNPNMKFPIRDSITSMAKTLGLPIPTDKGQILYGILTGDNQTYIAFDKSVYVHNQYDTSMGPWGSLTEKECTTSDGKVISQGKWIDGRPAISVRDSNSEFPLLLVYINTLGGVEIYDYYSEILIGYLEKSDNPDTYIRTTYQYQRNIDGHIINKEPIGTTVEEVPAGAVFVKQPKDDLGAALGVHKSSRGKNFDSEYIGLKILK
jgi:hypothetical protein